MGGSGLSHPLGRRPGCLSWWHSRSIGLHGHAGRLSDPTIPWVRSHSGTAAVSGMESSRRWAEIEAFPPIAKASSHPIPSTLTIHSPTHSLTPQMERLPGSSQRGLCARCTLGRESFCPEFQELTTSLLGRVGLCLGVQPLPAQARTVSDMHWLKGHATH